MICNQIKNKFFVWIVESEIKRLWEMKHFPRKGNFYWIFCFIMFFLKCLVLNKHSSKQHVFNNSKNFWTGSDVFSPIISMQPKPLPRSRNSFQKHHCKNCYRLELYLPWWCHFQDQLSHFYHVWYDYRYNSIIYYLLFYLLFYLL